MTRTTALHPATPWVEVSSTVEDWDAADVDLLITMHSQMVMIRAFEQAVLDLSGAGLVHGPAHSSIGQEAGAVGSAMVLGATDTVGGSHRGHHQFLAKALSYLSPKFSLAQVPADNVREMLHRTLSEICGLKAGFSGGRGGSMHLQWLEAGAIGTNAIVGGGVPLAAGYAWAHKQAGAGDVAVTYFGDGAANIGSTLETQNLAAAWDLPLCFFVENNLYAVSTHVSEVSGDERLSARGQGFAMPAWKVDGMDVLAVHGAMSDAVAHMRDGGGATLVEADLYRYFHQNGAFPGSAFGYRDKAEEAAWRERDPIVQSASHLVRRGILQQAELDSMEDRARETMEALIEEILEPHPQPSKPGERRIRPELWPDTEFADVGVRGEGSEVVASEATDLDRYPGELTEGKFITAVASVMERRMETDPRIVVLGEDVHHLKGGTNGATKNLVDRWPDRVLGTPIAENAFTGLGLGMALDGRHRPVVEFMYADFMWVAADQLFNQVGKARHMFGGTHKVPFVLRSKVAIGTGYGSQHSMDPAGIFATAPGWRIVAPTTPFDYVGLMNTALQLDDPVVVLEHVDLYTSTGPMAVDDCDYFLPVGAAAVRRAGEGCTVLTYLGMTPFALEAADAVPGADAEVIDLRWLDRASIDWDTIGDSIRKTNRVIIAEQGPIGTSYGSWLSDEIQRRYFDWLDAPVQRVTGREASPSISKVLERSAIAQADEVIQALHTIEEV